MPLYVPKIFEVIYLSLNLETSRTTQWRSSSEFQCLRTSASCLDDFSYSHTAEVIWSQAEGSSNKSPIKYNLQNHLTPKEDDYCTHKWAWKFYCTNAKMLIGRTNLKNTLHLNKSHLFSVLQILSPCTLWWVKQNDCF